MREIEFMDENGVRPEDTGFIRRDSRIPEPRIHSLILLWPRGGHVQRKISQPLPLPFTRDPARVRGSWHRPSSLHQTRPGRRLCRPYSFPFTREPCRDSPAQRVTPESTPSSAKSFPCFLCFGTSLPVEKSREENGKSEKLGKRFRFRLRELMKLGFNSIENRSRAAD